MPHEGVDLPTTQSEGLEERQRTRVDVVLRPRERTARKHEDRAEQVARRNARGHPAIEVLRLLPVAGSTSLSTGNQPVDERQPNAGVRVDRTAVSVD